MRVTMQGELLLSKEAFKSLLQVVLEKKLPFRVQATGNSMSPFIRAGDIVVISPFPGNQPHRGDVVAYLSPRSEAVIIHRIIRRVGQQYFIGGDNSLEPIEIVAEERLLGRVQVVERNGKRVRFSLNNLGVVVAVLNSLNLLHRLLKISRKVVRATPRRLDS
jgi:signal peptidase I